MMYRLFLAKRMIEDLLLYPFIWTGRRRARKMSWKRRYDIVFLFPFHHTGGAEKVHAMVARAFSDKTCLIIFTRRSKNDGFLKDFQDTGHDIWDISDRTDVKKAYWRNLVWRGVVSGLIDRQEPRPVVFNGQCNFAYKCAPWVDRRTRQIELIHSFNSFSWIRIPFLPFYERTVMISRKAIADHERQYRKLGIGETLFQRIEYIRNGVAVPEDSRGKGFEGGRLHVLYAGRGTSEKRVYLVKRIAARCRELGVPADFSFMGDVDRDGTEDGGSSYMGNLKDEAQIDLVYRSHEVLILTSSEEGFPMVVMEAMARGCIILSTPVGELPMHIRAGEQGWLFSSVSDETAIVEEGVGWIRRILADRSLAKDISSGNIEYARMHFSAEAFEKAYRDLLMPQSPNKAQTAE